MPDRQTSRPCAAAKDRPWQPSDHRLAEAELEAQYRRIGIGAVAAAAIARAQAGKQSAQ